MARLMLSLDGQVLAEYNMNKERYTIGRLPDNDIRIDNPAVSGHHSLIINILNDSFLEDLNSTNGTYVNGKLIKKHAMQHGDVITVGHHQLRFVDSQSGDTAQEEFEKTMVINSNTQGEDRIRRVGQAVDQAAKSLASKRASTAPVEQPHVAVAISKAKLQVLSGPFAGRELELIKALTTLGRRHVRIGERFAIFLDQFRAFGGFVFGLLNLFAENDVGRALRAHYGDLGGGPGEHTVGAPILAA